MVVVENAGGCRLGLENLEGDETAAPIRLGDEGSFSASTAAIKDSGVSILGDAAGSFSSFGRGLDCHRSRLAWKDARPSFVAGGVLLTFDVIIDTADAECRCCMSR